MWQPRRPAVAMQARSRRWCLALAWVAVVTSTAHDSGDCALHDTLADFHWARVKGCEEALLESEFARFRKHTHRISSALTKHKFRLAHRDQFPFLLNRLGLNGSAVEIGVREGHWSRIRVTRWGFNVPSKCVFVCDEMRLGDHPPYETSRRDDHSSDERELKRAETKFRLGPPCAARSRMFLEHWGGSHYHGIDPLPLNADLESYRTTKNMPEVYEYGIETIAKLNADPRWTFHHEVDAVFVDDFEDASLDFVYIDSVHDYAHVKETFERWWPKVKAGGIIAGHDYCIADIDKRESGIDTWPTKSIKAEVADRGVPLCGKYGCIEGEFCYPKDMNRKGRPKFGFAGVAYAAIEAVEREQTLVQMTGEAGVVGNPSWWAAKP